MTVYKAKRHFDVPQLDLLTLLFDSEHSKALDNTPLHAEAADPSNVYTKGEARAHTQRLAYILRNQFGVGASGPGKDVVTVVSSGQAYLPVAFYGIIATGGVYSAASASFTFEELARQVRDGPSNLIICSLDVLEVAKRAAGACSVPLNRVLVLESSPVWRLYDVKSERDVLSSSTSRLDWERITDEKTLVERPICLLYSSGTTGLPKGVPLSNRNIVAEVVLPAAVTREVLAKREAEGEPPFEWRTLAHLPAAHIAGVQGYFINPFYHGGLVFWMPKFDFGLFLHYNRQFQCTWFFTVPPIYLLIAKSPAVKDHFRTIQHVITGAAPMGAELQQAASDKLGDARTWISQTWGLSESTGSATFMPWDRIDKTGSVSALLPNMSARIVGEDGKDVPPGSSGEIWLKGPVVFRGYHNRPDENAKAFQDGWFCTGDIGEMRGDLLYIVDRKKELIKYKGMQVAPAELEALLLSHELIMDAAVIGVDQEATEVPRAYVVADKTKISEQAIKDFVKKNAASHKQLRGGVVFIDAIPKSPSGKILRRDLRELVKKEGRAKL